ncbi:MAG TPA: glycine/betaine ABC transporter substrate-binding protein [Clostridia bacterium]|nr:glycine/betaine ABC transporter substrate-binding protein [Clostridia bacterium]
MFTMLTMMPGCGTHRGSEQSEKSGKIVVGCKQFTEQYIIGEMLAQLVENNTDLKVERKFGLGNVQVIHQAITQGDIDVYPEYTSTGLYAQLKEETDTRDPDAIYQMVKQRYKEKWDIDWLSPLGFNNTYSLAVTKETAQRLGVKTYSDLAPHTKDLVFGGTAAFFDRADGMPGLVKTYGYQFKKTVSMDSGLMYRALKDGQVDVIPAFSTDGRIAAYDLVILEDDKNFFPPYYLAPVVRGETLRKHPELREVLDSLAGAIDDATMAKLNSQVDLENKEPEEVAREFLKSKGLIK